MRQVEFMFLEQKQAGITATGMTPKMMNYPMHKVNDAYYSQQAFQADKVHQALLSFSPDNMQLTLSSKEFEGTTSQVEQYYGIKYSVSPIEDTLLASLVKGEYSPLKSSLKLDLPEKNSFIASGLEAISQKEEGPHDQQPSLLLETDKSTLYYQRDNKYLVPKGHIFVKVFTNENKAGLSPLGDMFQLLWADLMDMKLSQLTYQADMASLQVESARSPNGVQYHFSGLSPNLASFLAEYFQSVLSLDIATCQNEFDMLKEKKVQAFGNYPKHQSYQIAMHFHKCLSQLRDNQTFQDMHL